MEPEPSIPIALDSAGQMIADWRSNPDRVAWWNDVLRHPFGRELAAIATEFGPETDLGEPATLNQWIKSSEGALGMVSGHNRLRTLLFKRLATHVTPVFKPLKPGGATLVEPHTGTPPS